MFPFYPIYCCCLRQSSPHRVEFQCSITSSVILGRPASISPEFHMTLEGSFHAFQMLPHSGASTVKALGTPLKTRSHVRSSTNTTILNIMKSKVVSLIITYPTIFIVIALSDLIIANCKYVFSLPLGSSKIPYSFRCTEAVLCRSIGLFPLPYFIIVLCSSYKYTS